MSPATQDGLRHPLARDRQQALGGVEAGDLRAAVGGRAQEDAGAAAEVEHRVVVADARCSIAVS